MGSSIWVQAMSSRKWVQTYGFRHMGSSIWVQAVGGARSLVGPAWGRMCAPGESSENCAFRKEGEGVRARVRIRVRVRD
jgi:hypothetical protein